MITVTYSLKKKAHNSYLVYLALYEDSKTELISSKRRCTGGQWDKKGNQPKDSDLSVALQKIKLAVEIVQKKMELDNQAVTPFTLKQAYLKTLIDQGDIQEQQDKKEKTNSSLVSTSINTYLKEAINHFKPKTKKAMKNSLTTFKEFLEKKKWLHIQRRDLTPKIISTYESYMTEDLSYADSTHGKKMKDLRYFLDYINYDKSPIADIKVRLPKKDERNIIHLTQEELAALEACDVSKSSELQKSKDTFLLGCYTGMRISTLQSIRKHHIVNGSLKIFQDKNSTDVYIPILSPLKAILERYNYSAPVITEQKVNEGIKKVCEKAFIDTPIEFKMKKGGVVIKTVYPKFKKITTHCAGKTFISLAGLKYDLTPVEIAAIVGKNLKTVMEYYLSPDLERARQKMIEADKRAQMTIVKEKVA